MKILDAKGAVESQKQKEYRKANENGSSKTCEIQNP